MPLVGITAQSTFRLLFAALFLLIAAGAQLAVVCVSFTTLSN